jgi:hypothetical protein
MRKLPLLLLIAILSMTAFRAVAQPPTQAYGVSFSNIATCNCQIEQLTVGVTSSQPPAIFQPPNTFTNAGTFTQPNGLFLLGGYWTTPSLATPLQISIGPGYSMQIKNNDLYGSITRRIGVILANPNGSGSSTVIYGAPFEIPGQGTVTIPVPTAAVTYTSATLPTLGSDPNYRIPIAILFTY